jgi:ElaB/YqjD/DUF883 family membrane-anchored ribosome-binding protein
VKNQERQLNDLLEQTDKLLTKLSDEYGPEIDELRGKLDKSMAQAREAMKNDPSPEHVKVRHVAASFNDYVRNYPWLALATGVLVASTIGILSTSATRRSMRH